MWRSKKFIIIAILTVVILGAILGGYAVAQADDQNTNQTSTANVSTLLDKVASIYQQNTGKSIDSQELSKAFTQAGKEIRNEALDKYLNSLVEKGKITKDQAKQYKDWLNSKPDVQIGPGFKGGPRGFGKFGGMFRGWCAPKTGTGTSTQ